MAFGARGYAAAIKLVAMYVAVALLTLRGCGPEIDIFGASCGIHRPMTRTTRDRAVRSQQGERSPGVIKS